MAVIFFIFTIAIPALLSADNNIPTTPLTRVLSYKTGLELTDSQVKKLTILDNTIKEKMIQTRAQAQIRKQEIDKFTSNWNMMNGTACCRLVKEYFQFVAELKTLELNAIMQVRAVLTVEQLRKFNELASLESMILDLEPKISSSF
jgi:hypothetical protein